MKGRGILLGIALVVAGAVFADTRLTNDSGRSELTFGGRTAVCASDFSGNTYVVWSDDRSGDFEIYYKRRNSSDGSWDTDSRITNSSGYSRAPVAVVDVDANLHAIWMDSRDGDWEIYWDKWYGSWDGETRLTSSSGFSGFPDVCADSGGGISVVWMDSRDGNYEIYFRHWDPSSGWGAEQRLTYDDGASMYPAISEGAGGKIYVVWQDNRTGNWEIYLKTYDGSSWSEDIQVSNTAGDSWMPDVAAMGNECLIVWQDNSDGDWDIMFRRRVGDSWESQGVVRNTDGISISPAVAQNTNQYCVVWNETGSDNVPKIFMRKFTDGVWSTSIVTLSADGSNSYFPSVIADRDHMFRVVWQDFRDGNHEIYYTAVDEALFTEDTEKPEMVSLNIHPSPFNQACYISARVPFSGRMEIYDLSGKLIVTHDLVPGENHIIWTAAGVPSGTYLVKISDNHGHKITRKVTLVR